MSRQLEGSCAKSAASLGLSRLATLALRVSLMILRRITWRDEDLCLKVDMSPSKLSIRVSRLRRFTSRPVPGRTSKAGPVSGYTETTPPSIEPEATAALSLAHQDETRFERVYDDFPEPLRSLS